MRLLGRFKAVRGQEIRYGPPHPVKMVIGSTLAAPESADCVKTRDFVGIASAVSIKPVIVYR